jgi:hypothetical protein
MTVSDAIVLLAAELPDPGRLSTITFAGTFGTVVGALIAHLRDLPSEKANKAMRSGLIAGFGAGLLGWIVSYAMDLL